MIVVSDTSSISNLIQINRIDLLQQLYRTIIITPAVRKELFQVPEHQAALAQRPWIVTQKPSDARLVFELESKLDLGEAESIALAIELKPAFLFIDETKGRRIATEYGIRVVGVLGILVKCKQQNLLPAIRPEILHLIDIGFRLSPSLVNHVLLRAGEPPLK